MSLIRELNKRAGEVCELCAAEEGLKTYLVPPKSEESIDNCILACAKCINDINDPATADANHWRCLNDSMWSPVPAVQVVAWRMLDHLRAEGWPNDLLDMLFLDEETSEWAQALKPDPNAVVHYDSNGSVLEAGDTVTLVQDLNVKGASFTAKRGTAVRRITLVHDNPEHIEGKVNGQRIVILTKYVKKAKA